MSEISTPLEAHREILLRLSAITQLDPKRYYPADNDRLCRFCGIRPRQRNLCVECEARRVRLAALFPDVPPPIQDIKPPVMVSSSSSDMTALGLIQRPTWSQHNSE